MYIYMRKEEEFEGYMSRHSHISKNKSNAYGWSEGSREIEHWFKLPNETAFTNIRIVSLERRSKGGEAYQTLADVEIEGITYTIRFDSRIHHIMDYMTYLGINVGGKLPEQNYYYVNGAMYPLVKGLPNYEDVLAIALSNERKNKASEGGIEKITKANIEQFTAYERIDGSIAYFVGLVSNAKKVGTPNKRFLVLNDSDGILTKSDILDKLIDKEFTVINKQPNFTRKIGSFVAEGIDLDDLLYRYNKEVFSYSKYFGYSNGLYGNKRVYYGRDSLITDLFAISEIRDVLKSTNVENFSKDIADILRPHLIEVIEEMNRNLDVDTENSLSLLDRNNYTLTNIKDVLKLFLARQLDSNCLTTFTNGNSQYPKAFDLSEVEEILTFFSDMLVSSCTKALYHIKDGNIGIEFEISRYYHRDAKDKLYAYVQRKFVLDYHLNADNKDGIEVPISVFDINDLSFEQMIKNI